MVEGKVGSCGRGRGVRGCGRVGHWCKRVCVTSEEAVGSCGWGLGRGGGQLWWWEWHWFQNWRCPLWEGWKCERPLVAGASKEVVSKVRRLASSSSLSCRRWLFPRFAIRWKGIGGLKSRSVNLQTREQATNVRRQMSVHRQTLSNINHHFV